MGLKVCPRCASRMERILTGVSVRFKCTSCGEELEGGPEDTRVAQHRVGAAGPGARQATSETYLRFAAGDRAARRVWRVCPGCGINTMIYVQQEDRSAIYICPMGCGGGAAPPDAAAGAAPPSAAPSLAKTGDA